MHRHVRSTPSTLPTPSSRFETVHIDIVGPLPPSRNQRYLLTCIDRFSRWVEAIPMEDCTAETTWRAFMSGWVSRFGAPNTVITDQGVQFESTLWRNQLSALGSKRSRTTAYHPQSNGLLERVHRRLKEGIKTQPEPHNWIDTLPTLLLYLHATPATDTNVSPAEYVFGEELRLPGQFSEDCSRPSQGQTLLEMLNHAAKTRAPPTRKPKQRTEQVPPELCTADQVLVRVDAVRTGLQSPYQGPFKVLKRHPKFFTIDKNGSPTTVAIDRLKKFHATPQPPISSPHSTNGNPVSRQPETISPYRTKSGRSTRLPVRFSTA